jgi:pimeloyl-ACP methyl ester carboxylesterase
VFLSARMTDLLLIPGAGGDARYWDRVVPLLEAEGYRATAVELPSGDSPAGLNECAERVVQVARPGETTVVIAQSLGAFVAPLVAERIRLGLIILVAPMIPAPAETAGEWWANTGQEEAARAFAVSEGRDPDAAFDLREVFLHDVPREVQQRVLAGGERAPTAASFTTRWNAKQWPDVPVRVIACRFDRFFPLPFVQRLARERLGVEPAVIDSGHLPALGHPVELAAQLHRDIVAGLLTTSSPTPLQHGA